MLKIIAVDDEYFSLMSIEGEIKDALPNCDLAVFNTADKAISYVKENQPDIAFLDIEMGEMNGIELAKHLKGIYSKINIIFITGYSEYAVDAFGVLASDYILKPVTKKLILDAMTRLREPVKIKDARLRVQTFGNFEVFKDEKPLYFPRSKSKELFAYLISRCGTGCNSKEIAAVLFEDLPYKLSLQKQVQTIISVMLKVLKEERVADVIIKNFNSISIDVNKVNCDYYHFIKGDVGAVNAYMGEFMTGYSWAEFVVGYLDKKIL